MTKFLMNEMSLSIHTIYNTLSTSDLNKNDLAAQSNGRLIYFHGKPAHLIMGIMINGLRSCSVFSHMDVIKKSLQLPGVID